MTDLVACLSTGKNTWGHLSKVILGIDWNKVYLVTTEEFKDEFKSPKEANLIVLDTKRTIPEMAEDIKKSLSGKVCDLEVGLNIISGEGREHMAIISALLELGLGIRLVVLTKEGVKVV